MMYYENDRAISYRIHDIQLRIPLEEVARSLFPIVDNITNTSNLHWKKNKQLIMPLAVQQYVRDGKRTNFIPSNRYEHAMTNNIFSYLRIHRKDVIVK